MTSQVVSVIFWPREKILVSACLLGENTRYDGKNNYFPFIEKLRVHYDIVPFCPEVEAGLSIPRVPAEISHGSVITKDGKDLTKLYNAAAEKALQLCRLLNIKTAILKDRSPAGGPRNIHDGSFNGNVIEGHGITAHYLIKNGVKVYCETDNLSFLLSEEKPVEKNEHIERKEPRKTFKKPYKKTFNKNHKDFKKDHKDFKKDGKKPFHKSLKKNNFRRVKKDA